MSTRDDYPAGVPCWVDTNQPDPESAARFYSGLFGWETEDMMPPDSGGHYFMGRIGGRDAAAISSRPVDAPSEQATWNTYIRVESADDAAAKVRDAGGTVLSEPFDVFDSGRMGVFADPEGAVFSVWQAGSHRGSAAVNEHGAVNFNTLHTDDADAARAFYGAVFGWSTIDVERDVMWTLPGYGDYLETLNPGMRAGMKEMGAPAGFEDVVAALEPRDGRPARWTVTFGVDDADLIVSRAGELGGTVLAGPSTAPWTRYAVLADPAGAEFVVSQFVPPSS
jgi:predicted enzyme related to lactoylglutathione lyase